MSAPESLLTTKLYLPPKRPTLVSRPRLLALLGDGLERPLTLVSAPPGFGKTSLFSEWRASPAGSKVPVAWFSLDRDDNDPDRFLRYLVAALGSLEPGIGEPALAALQLHPPPPVEAILTALVNELNTFPKPFVLVLDDYHVITSLAVHELVKFLLDHLPPAMHVVLLTRADPPLPLARLRALDQLTAIRQSDLRFFPKEAAEFLNGVMGLKLSAQDVNALAARTEGWIAGLQLAALSLRQQADKHAFVAAFAGDDRYIMDYLLEEVLQRQPAEVQSFLLKTSILERLCDPLCEAVMGQAVSQTSLASLEQANLFVVSLDNRRTWYRYHHLFADLLRRRLQQTLPGEERLGLYRRACAWYEGQGLVVEAISQALAAPDYELAVSLLERHVLAIFFRSETMQVHNWLKALPDDVLRKRPLLCIMYANTIAHSLAYQPQALESAEDWLRVAEGALASLQAKQGSERDNASLIRSFLDMTRAYVALWRRSTPQTVIDLARKAMAGLPPADAPGVDPNFSRLRSGLNNNLGVSYLELGDEEAAMAAFTQAQHVGEMCGDLLNTYAAVWYQSKLLRQHGRLPEVAALCRETLGSADRTGSRSERSIPYTGLVYTALGMVLLEWNELPSAEAALSRGMELSRLTASEDGLLESSIAMARLRQARGDHPGAFEVMDRLKPRVSGARDLIEACRARMHLAQSWQDSNSLAYALNWARNRELFARETFWGWAEYLALVRVLIAQQREHPRASSATLPGTPPLQASLQDQLAAAKARGAIERSIELHMLQALAFQVESKLPEALAALRQALLLAEPGGYVRLFVDEGMPMRQLLSRLKEDKGELNVYVNRLLSAWDAAGATLSADLQPGLVFESLSAREMDVLRLLAGGASNAEIARKLFITLNTTKKHVTHIFEKLAVTDRSQAAQRARELGLIQLPPR